MSDGGEGLLDACAPACPEPSDHPGDRAGRLAGRRPMAAGDGMAVVESARASGLALAGGPDGQRPGRRHLPGGPVSCWWRRRAGCGAGRDRRASGSAARPPPTAVSGLWRPSSRPADSGAPDWSGPATSPTRFVEAAAVFGPAEGGGPRPGGGAGRAPRAHSPTATAIATGSTSGVCPVRGRPGDWAARSPCSVALWRRVTSSCATWWDSTGALRRGRPGGDRRGRPRRHVVPRQGRGRGGRGRPADGVATLVVAGRCTGEGADRARGAGCAVVSLAERFGHRRAGTETGGCVAEATADWLGPAGPAA